MQLRHPNSTLCSSPAETAKSSQFGGSRSLLSQETSPLATLVSKDMAKGRQCFVYCLWFQEAHGWSPRHLRLEIDAQLIAGSFL